MKPLYLIAILLSLFFQSVSQVSTQPVNSNLINFKKGKLLYKDDFDKNLNNWIAEIPSSPNSKVSIEDKRLLIDVDGGATIWFNKKLSGNIMIEFNRKVVIANGKNDRLSDLNVFWMATDPRKVNLFTRKGVLSEYDSLQLYYVGFGGNTNKTTRFRKYPGNGDRILLKEYTDKPHLLEANRDYLIRIVVYHGATRFYVDDEEWFSYDDRDPLREGYFGFRTTESRQSMDNFKVYKLK